MDLKINTVGLRLVREFIVTSLATAHVVVTGVEMLDDESGIQLFRLEIQFLVKCGFG